MRALLGTLIAVVLLVGSSALAGPRKKTRVDFDDLVVRGQTKKADAIYLFDRGELKEQELTSPRQDYRKEIIETMFE